MNRNEQIKLLATAFNNLGVGSLLASIVVPWIDHSLLGIAALGWYVFGLLSLATAQLVLWEME